MRVGQGQGRKKAVEIFGGGKGRIILRDGRAFHGGGWETGEPWWRVGDGRALVEGAPERW